MYTIQKDVVERCPLSVSPKKKIRMSFSVLKTTSCCPFSSGGTENSVIITYEVCKYEDKRETNCGLQLCLSLHCNYYFVLKILRYEKKVHNQILIEQTNVLRFV